MATPGSTADPTPTQPAPTPTQPAPTPVGVDALEDLNAGRVTIVELTAHPDSVRQDPNVVHWGDAFFTDVAGVHRSPDGLAWTPIQGIDGRLAANSARLIAYSAGNIWVSSDGLDWQLIEDALPAPPNQFADLSDVVGWSDGFVALGATIPRGTDVCVPACGDPAFWTSNDAERWELVVPGPIFGPNFPYSLSAGQDRLLLLVAESELPPSSVMQSIDGVDWMPLEPQLFAQERLYTMSLAGDERTFALAIELGDDGFGDVFEASVWELTNGRWIDRTPEPARIRSAEQDVRFESMAAVSGGYLLTGYARADERSFVPLVWASTDGIDWTEIELPGGNSMPQVVGSSDERIVISGIRVGGDRDGRPLFWVTEP